VMGEASVDAVPHRRLLLEAGPSVAGPSLL
jgi:hypothetical protein